MSLEKPRTEKRANCSNCGDCTCKITTEFLLLEEPEKMIEPIRSGDLPPNSESS